jgi:hypothetical protein
MKVLGRIFLKSRKERRKSREERRKSRKERRKDGKTEFFVRCRRTYVLNKRKYCSETLIIYNTT